ncbi:MAG: DegT/DnrJ/EryC1/StrS family aminotransferase [bacterium]
MSAFSIPFYDPKSENLEFSAEFQEALGRVLMSGRFVLGPELAQLEQELAEYLGVNQVIGVKSGTDALFLGLRALGIGKGDEIITTPFTFPATIEAIRRTGARPVLVDIEPDTLCLSPELCINAITAKTKAILLVHLFGNCADINRFLQICEKNNLLLIEDAAQAIGSTYHSRKLGSFGAVSAFSFYPTKNLGALGNGGALVGQNLQVDCPNSARLDELQAAFLRTKLRHLDRWLTRRRIIAQCYESNLGRYVRIIRSAPNSMANLHQFAIRTGNRDRLRCHLASKNIQTMVYYPEPIHHRPEFVGWFDSCSLPEAERASAEVLCLPIRQNLTDAEQQAIINSIVEFFNQL